MGGGGIRGGFACINYEGCGMFALVNKSCLTLSSRDNIANVAISNLT